MPCTCPCAYLTCLAHTLLSPYTLPCPHHHTTHPLPPACLPIPALPPCLYLTCPYMPAMPLHTLPLPTLACLAACLPCPCLMYTLPCLPAPPTTLMPCPCLPALPYLALPLHTLYTTPCLVTCGLMGEDQGDRMKDPAAWAALAAHTCQNIWNSPCLPCLPLLGAALPAPCPLPSLPTFTLPATLTTFYTHPHYLPDVPCHKTHTCLPHLQAPPAPPAYSGGGGGTVMPVTVSTCLPAYHLPAPTPHLTVGDTCLPDGNYSGSRRPGRKEKEEEKEEDLCLPPPAHATLPATYPTTLQNRNDCLPPATCHHLPPPACPCPLPHTHPQVGELHC